MLAVPSSRARARRSTTRSKASRPRSPRGRGASPGSLGPSTGSGCPLCPSRAAVARRPAAGVPDRRPAVRRGDGVPGGAGVRARDGLAPAGAAARLRPQSAPRPVCAIVWALHEHGHHRATALGRDPPSSRARRARVRRAPRGRDGGRARHPRSRAAPRAKPHRHLRAGPLVRGLQARHLRPRDRESAPDARHLHRGPRHRPHAGVRAALPHRGRRQPVRQPVLPARRRQRVLLRPLDRPVPDARGGASLLGGGGARAPGCHLVRGRHPDGAGRPARFRSRPRGRARAARAARRWSTSTRAERHAQPAPVRPGEAGRGRADGHGGAPVAQGRPRGAQSDRRHRAERRAPGRHRPRATRRRRDGRGGKPGGRHPRPGLRPRRADRGIPGLRPISPRPVRGRFRQRHGQLGGRVREARWPRARRSPSRSAPTRASRRWRSTGRCFARRLST